MDDKNQVQVLAAIIIGTSFKGTGTKKITKFCSDVQTLRIKRNTDKPWKERKLRKAKSQR